MSGRRQSRGKSRRGKQQKPAAEQMPLSHILVIVDGNRRYARKAGVSLLDSYKKSVDNIHWAVRWLSVEEKIPVVSFFIVADYNFERPRGELKPMFEAAYYAADVFSRSNGVVRYRICGSLERFPSDIAEYLWGIENYGNGRGNLVNLLIGYSGQEDRQAAIEACQEGNMELTEEGLLQHSALGPTPIDVIVRTGGVIRLSDGPMVGISQSRMYPIDKLFPEIRKRDIMSVVNDYRTGRRV